MNTNIKIFTGLNHVKNNVARIDNNNLSCKG
jgi:hypothetical protein